MSPTAGWLLLLLIEFLLVAGMGFLTFALAGRRSPLTILREGVGRLFGKPEYRGLFLWVIVLPVVDILESGFDDSLTAALGYDMTPWIHGLEGDWASWIQRLEWLPATWLFTFVYIILVPVLLAAPIVLAAAEEKLETFRALSLGLVINYIIGLPFYFLFPVKEMWAGNPDHVRLLMDRVSPAIMEAYRANSALDNCFPSLHTSLALTVPIIAGRTWGRPFAWAAWTTAIAVVFSTLYLGIHWASDVAAGAVLAVTAGMLALSLARQGGSLYHAPMGFFGDLRDAREMERLSIQADLDEAGKKLEKILERHPGDARAATLIAFSRSERGELLPALEAAELAAKDLAPAASRILKAEVLLDSGRRREARTCLEEARELDPSNIVAPGLLAVLDLTDGGMRGARSGILNLPPASLWSRAVLSRLVLALEEALEGLPPADPACRDLHKARTILFRPRIENDPRKRSRVRRGILAMETAFVEERFTEVEKLHREWIEEGGDAADPYPAALRAYALIALDRAARALEALSTPLSAGGPIAELLHLAAIAELKLGRRPRAAGALRRAAALDDIAMVSLAKEEAALIAGGPSDPGKP